MNKKKLLCVIDNLTRGGAEMMLVGILPELNKHFTVILVTLSDEYEFESSELVYSKRYSLGFNGRLSFFPAIYKLKKIIKENRPHLIHAHLFNSSVVARAACPADVPLAYSLHTIMSKDAFQNSWLNKWLEQSVFKKRFAVIAVSGEVLDDYQKDIGETQHSFILENYISDVFIRQGSSVKNISPANGIKMIAIGNVKPVKNYIYLLKAFAQLKDLPVCLHIYGKTHPILSPLLQEEIDKNKLNIILKGRVNNIEEILPAYDLYVMSSIYEGFGIAPVEAMAMGLPVLLSDLRVLREVTGHNGIFFNVGEPGDFVRIIREIFLNKYNLAEFSARGIKLATEQYGRKLYIEKLLSIYAQLLGPAGTHLRS